MPELPEVETVRMYLERELVGETIRSIVAVNPRSLQGDTDTAVNRIIGSVRRFGKMLLLDLDQGIHIGIHLKMSGQLLLAKSDTGSSPQTPDKHTRVIVYFVSGNRLVFNDQRMFGWIRVMKTVEFKILGFIRKLGPEPFYVSDAEFYRIVHKRKRPVKSVLLDQEIIAGVGNIYANDSLWEAKIHPNRRADQLTETETSQLLKSLVNVLNEGIRYGGSTGKDRTYIHPDGGSGSYQDHFRVYDRAGQPCRRQDGGIVEKTNIAGRGTFYCPVCQHDRRIM